MEIIFLKEKTFTYNVHMSDFLMNNIFSYYSYFFRPKTFQMRCTSGPVEIVVKYSG